MDREQFMAPVKNVRSKQSNKGAGKGTKGPGKDTKGKAGNTKGKGDGKKGGKPTARDGGCFTCGAQGRMAKDCPKRVLAVVGEKEEGEIHAHAGLDEETWFIGGIVGACDGDTVEHNRWPLLVDSGALRSVVGQSHFVGRAHDPERPFYDVSGNKLPHYGPVHGGLGV